MNNTNHMKIPSKSRKEWRQLLSGELDIPLKNFFFQMKVTQARTQIEKGIVSMESAINDLHILCNKFSKAKNMPEDLKLIFGENYMDDVPKKTVITKENETSDRTNITDITKEKTNNDSNKNILKNIKSERELLFLTKSLEQKEKELQDKTKLTITLQEELILLRKKNSILYEGLHKIEEIKNENQEVENQSEDKSGWSFFNLFKKSN